MEVDFRLCSESYFLTRHRSSYAWSSDRAGAQQKRSPKQCPGFKGLIKPKSRLARHRFSQKTNGRIWFVCHEENSKQNKFVHYFFGRIYGAPICLPNNLTFSKITPLERMSTNCVVKRSSNYLPPSCLWPQWPERMVCRHLRTPTYSPTSIQSIHHTKHGRLSWSCA